MLYFLYYIELVLVVLDYQSNQLLLFHFHQIHFHLHIQDVTGWEFTNAEKTQITKTFTENTTNTTITLKDILGNESKVQITIQNIDTTSPTIQGIENGKTYNQAVKPTVTDENLSSVTLKKDGTIVTGYQNGNSISENGQYELQAVDAAGNTTTVTFKIEL